MSARPWIALLLLTNYLLVVGMDCVNRPEDQPQLIRLLTSEEGHFYQECRYMRMDGLELFLDEIMASSLQNGPKTSNHHLISVISGVNAHDLVARWQLVLPSQASLSENALPVAYQLAVLAGVRSLIKTPPWQA